MKYRILYLLILGGSLSACDKPDKQIVSQPDTAVPATVLLAEPVHVMDPDPMLINQDTSLNVRNPIDTRITAEMIKDIQFDVKNAEAEDFFSNKPLNLNPAGNKQISITPKLYLENDDTIKQSYRDYINGGEVQVEVKFD